MPRLRITAGGSPGQVYPLDRSRLVIGRHPQCEIVIPSASVSRNHAQIVNRDGIYYLEDLQSRNHTYVNEQRVVEPVPLRHGDELRICDFQATFEEESPTRLGTALGSASRVSAIFVDEDDMRTQSSIRGRLSLPEDARRQILSVSPELKLRAFLELSQSLAKSLSLADVLPPVMETLFKIFPQSDSGFIVLCEADGSLRPVYTKFRNSRDDSVRISRGIMNLVISGKEAIISADASEDSRFSLTDSIAQLQLQSFMCAPFVTPEGEVLGAVQIDSRDPSRAFNSQDLDVMLGVASQAALSIQNAQLHEAALRQQALQRDLELAREVQRSLLPRERPECATMSFFDYYEPASLIGGDYFDYVRLPDGRIAVIVADVSGHGISAALLMTKLSAEARFCLATNPEPGPVLTQLNQVLCRDGVEDRFVTMVLILLDPNRSTFSLANAGHLSPIVVHRDGTLERLSENTKGPPLGVVPSLVYAHEMGDLDPEEVLILVTDGVSEAMDTAGEQFGFQRLDAVLREPIESAEDVGRRIIGDVRQFVAAEPQSDDICIVCLQRCRELPRPGETA